MILNMKVLYPFLCRYTIIENLRYMLSPYDPTEPIYFGCRFKKYVKEGYMSGGKVDFDYSLFTFCNMNQKLDFDSEFISKYSLNYC